MELVSECLESADDYDDSETWCKALTVRFQARFQNPYLNYKDRIKAELQKRLREKITAKSTDQPLVSDLQRMLDDWILVLDQLNRDREINQAVRRDRDNELTVVRKIQERSVQTLSRRVDIRGMGVGAEDENEAENDAELNTEDNHEGNKEGGEGGGEGRGEEGGEEGGEEDGEELPLRNTAGRRRGGNTIRSANRSTAVIPHRQRTNALDRITESMGTWLERDHQRENETAVLTELPAEVRALNQRLEALEDTVGVVHDNTRRIFNNTKEIFNHTRAILLDRGIELTYKGLNPQGITPEGEEEGRIRGRSR